MPYMRCYCSICRKTTGGGGYSINISGNADSLEVEGSSNVKIYQATLNQGPEETISDHERYFCTNCGSHLWAYNQNWPELVHPLASAIDTPLPQPSENAHIMVGSKASWVRVEGGPQDRPFDEYPQESIAEFHDRKGWTVD